MSKDKKIKANGFELESYEMLLKSFNELPKESQKKMLKENFGSIYETKAEGVIWKG